MGEGKGGRGDRAEGGWHQDFCCSRQGWPCCCTVRPISSLEAEALVGLGPPLPGFRAWICPESPDATDLLFPGAGALEFGDPAPHEEGRRQEQCRAYFLH